MDKKIDLRIERTQKAIREAFLKLLKEKSYHQVTIQDIAKEAFINRNTFYLHYLDKEDLLEKLSSECLNDFEDSLKPDFEYIKNLKNEALYTIIEKIFLTMQKNICFYQAIMRDNEISCFMVQFKDIIRNHISKEFKQNKLMDSLSEKLRKIYIEYIVSGIVGVIGFWLNHYQEYSVEEIARSLFNIQSQTDFGVISEHFNINNQ